MLKFLRLLSSLLTPAQRRRYLLLQVFFLFVAVVQIAGVASVAPFVALVSNPSLIHGNRIAEAVYQSIGFKSDRDFLVAFAVLQMVIIVVSNAILAFSAWLTSSAARRLGLELQRDVYHGYLHRDFVEFSRLNSATLVTLVSQGIGRLVYMVVAPILNIVSSAFLVLLILGGLLWYRPTVAIVGGVVVGAGYFLIFGLIEKLLDHHGKVTWRAAHSRQRLLTESLGGIKEIKLAGTERIYEDSIADISRSAFRSETFTMLLGDLPRFALESIALCALLGLGIVLLMGPSPTSEIVGVLSLYAMAGYKLLPAAQTIFKSVAQIQSNIEIVRDLKPHVDAGRKAPPSSELNEVISPMPVADIAFRDVHYTYPGSDSPVLRGVSFNVPRRSIVVFVGSSGAGKSTMADLLLGLLTPTAGDIMVGEQSIRTNLKSWQRSVGYVPQNIFILDDTIAANIAFGSASAIDLVKAQQAARLAQIDDYIQTLPGQYEYRVGEGGAMLSGGQRQRIGIARALYHDAAVIVMDEATSALDSVTERDIIGTLEELKQTKTIVMIAHRLSTIKCADLVVVLAGGPRGGVGSFDELQASNLAFREIIAEGVDDVIADAA